MKVAYILESFPLISTTFIINEIIAMQKKSMDVVVFAFINSKEKIVHSQVKQIKSLIYFKSRQYLAIIYYHFYLFFIKPHRYIFTLLISLWPKNELFKLFFLSSPYVFLVYLYAPNLLHAHFGTRPANFCLLVKLMTGIPYTFTTHRYDIFEVIPKNYVLKSKMAIKHITISKYNKHYLINNFGVDGNKIEVIHCGVDFSRVLPVSSCNGENIILAIARLERHKGLDVLIRACAELKKQNFFFKCLIIGDGPERQELSRLIYSLNLSTVVELVGQKKQEEVFDFLAKAKVVVLPSLSEGISLSLMEAMACRVPVIGTNVNGNGELIEDGISGFLIQPDNGNVLIEKIKMLLTDESLSEKFAKAAYKKVFEVFNLDKEVEKLITIWQNGLSFNSLREKS